MQRLPEPELMVDRKQVADYVTSIRDLQLIAPTHLCFMGRAALVLPERAKVLDLGCGSGDPACLLACLRPDLKIVGVDLSPTMLAEAESVSVAMGTTDRVSFELDDMTKLEKFKNDSIDAVVSTLSMHHLPSFDALKTTAKEIRRVLKPKGCIFLADFARLPNERWVERFARRDRKVQPPIYEKDFRNSMRAAWSVEEFFDAFQLLGGNLRQQATWRLPFLQCLWMQNDGVSVPSQQPVRLLKTIRARNTYRFLNTWLAVGRNRMSR